MDKTIKIECLVLHREIDLGDFEPGRVYELKEEHAQRLLDQFPMRFKIADAPNDKSLTHKTREKK